MEGPKTAFPTFLAAEIICFALLGYLLIGRQIFVFADPMFFVTAFGLMTIGLFNVLQFRDRREFYALGVVVAVLFSLTWFLNHSFLLMARGLMRFLSLAAATLFCFWTVNRPALLRLRFGVFPVWAVSCAAFYVMINCFDVLIAGSPLLSDAPAFMQLITESVRLGGITGLGIGLGYDIARLLIGGAAARAGTGGGAARERILNQSSPGKKEKAPE